MQVRLGAYHYVIDPSVVGSSLASNILGWKWLTVTNTLAYYGMELITAVSGFVKPAQAALM
jgi:hypothetical protein